MRRAITRQPVHEVEDYERDLAAWREDDDRPRRNMLVPCVVLTACAIAGFLIAIWAGAVYAWHFGVGP